MSHHWILVSLSLFLAHGSAVALHFLHEETCNNQKKFGDKILVSLPTVSLVITKEKKGEGRRIQGRSTQRFSYLSSLTFLSKRRGHGRGQTLGYSLNVKMLIICCKCTIP